MNVRLRYAQDIEAIYFDLIDTLSYDSDEIKDGIIIDYDKNKRFKLLGFSWFMILTRRISQNLFIFTPNPKKIILC